MACDVGVMFCSSRLLVAVLFFSYFTSGIPGCGRWVVGASWSANDARYIHAHTAEITSIEAQCALPPGSGGGGGGGGGGTGAKRVGSGGGGDDKRPAIGSVSRNGNRPGRGGFTTVMRLLPMGAYGFQILHVVNNPFCGYNAPSERHSRKCAGRAQVSRRPLRHLQTSNRYRD